MDYIIRKANLDDREAIELLIAESARGLSREDYSEQQVESAIRTVFGVDTDLIVDSTYFVADSFGMLIGCGGWSKRRTLFGGDRFASRDSSELDPRVEAARVRAFFVHPEHARRGIGRAILSLCESVARTNSFRSIELMATLPGVKMYRACGYEGSERVEYRIGEGMSIEFVPMQKELQ
ncbi:GNAT family N-acetyltransferase (plasmid) [Phormidium sp. CLA17]|uniref:GNAT family N-acetyltransferase n=1 Tax=Leptolyngbya sp. Cla-17 TaxID=2803751 RepID=UPI0014926681|nr:GNAT family N-acetyltransferase [Leptolyngbya sp. Cla-17]MBM0745212.1 GNAT family N-acetyltransferase [Leptolyngbya sp. Cla-17]